MTTRPTLTPKEFASEILGKGLREDLESLGLNFILARQLLTEHYSALSELRREFENLVQRYNDKRRALLVERLLADGLGWCYGCKGPSALHDLSLLARTATRRSKEYSAESYRKYEDGYLEEYLILYTVCPGCYDNSWDDEKARRVVETDTGIYTNYKGILSPCEEPLGTRSIPPMRDIPGDLLERFEIPPEAHCTWNGSYPEIFIAGKKYGASDWSSPEIVMTK